MDQQSLNDPAYAPAKGRAPPANLGTEMHRRVVCRQRQAHGVGAIWRGNAPLLHAVLALDLHLAA